MKVETKVGNVILSENLSVHKFRVNINRQSFKLLYGDLYSDGISALIRELSTNAADSHIKAGKSDSPFEVHLPNDLEPFFYVRDFGTGLSRDQVCGDDGIYITFCDSDKAHSDDFTGCLGLGSKSPLSYTDNFTVESNYNGTKYSYAVFMDEAGNPSLAELGATPTDEPNGLKVEIAVQEKDFEVFRGKAAAVLSWFKVRPKVVGSADFQFDEVEYLRKTDRYGVRKEHGQSHVVMGNVAYPINASDFSWNKLDDIERAVIDYGVDLFVDMGDIEFVPAREKLRYTDKTVEGCKKFMKDAIESIREHLEAQVQAMPTVWQARKMMNDIKHSILGKVRSLGTVMYQGKEISEYIKFHALVQKLHPNLLDRMHPLYPKCESFAKKRENYSRRDEETIYCNGQKIYINDLERGGYARVHQHVRETCAGKAAYLLTGVSPEFLEETGIMEVAILASSLPKVERAKRERVNSDGTREYVKRTVMQEYHPSGGNYMTDWWTDVEVEPRHGGVYVCVSYGQIVEGETKTLPSEIKKMYLAVKSLRPDFKLFGIRPAHMGRIERYKQRWMKFEDYANLVLKTDLPQVAEKINLLRQWENVDNKERYDNFMNEVFEEYSTFGQFLAKLQKVKSIVEDQTVKAVLKLNEAVKNPLPLDGEANELAEAESNLSEKYPLMNYIDWWQARRTQFISNFSDYVRGIDDRTYQAEVQPIKEVV